MTAVETSHLGRTDPVPSLLGC
eukprot:COSAG02_NODE_29328_length_571_cov_0.972458_1_plen_21_part_01